MNKDEFKDLLVQSPREIVLDDLTTKDIHRLRISVKGTAFETFFMPSEYKKLYVIFSAVGRDQRPYPIFQRVTWYEFFDGMFLWIDDPTRNETNIAPTYYFGSKNVNYLDLICDIINKFLGIYGISYNNLVFISSSNGGFAALWCSRKLQGSTCLAYNPQINIPLYYQKVRKKFETALNVSFDDKSLDKRLYLYDISEERKSKICIYSNIRSPSDKIQMDYLFDKFGIPYKLGIQKINNIWIIIANVDAVDPHLAQPLQYMTHILEELMRDEWDGMKITSKKIEIINAFISDMKDYYKIMKKNKELESKIESIKNILIDNK